jgi:spermidine synthase
MTHETSVKKVLVIGGGEGATLRELLKWKNLDSVTMIDWDKELVEYFRKHEFHWHRGAFEDPRVTLEARDIFEAVKEDRKYDVIIVDLVDPDMSDPKWVALFKRLVGWLGEKGVMSVNAGGVFPWDSGDVPAIRAVLKEGMGGAVHHMFQHKKWVPSFGREWAFVILKNY